ANFCGKCWNGERPRPPKGRAAPRRNSPSGLLCRRKKRLRLLGLGLGQIQIQLAQVGEMSVAQIELAFDPPARFVFQLAFTIELVNHIAFDRDELVFDSVVDIDAFSVATVLAAALDDMLETFSVASAQR